MGCHMGDTKMFHRFICDLDIMTGEGGTKAEMADPAHLNNFPDCVRESQGRSLGYISQVKGTFLCGHG